MNKTASKLLTKAKVQTDFGGYIYRYTLPVATPLDQTLRQCLSGPEEFVVMTVVVWNDERGGQTEIGQLIDEVLGHSPLGAPPVAV